MRVLVCGGRDYDDYDYLKVVLSALRVTRAEIDVIIHGKARGADTLAAQYAERHMIPTLAYPADWGTHGRSAGPIRNRQMLIDGKPDLVVAFKGGKGTADMVKQAKAAGVEVIETHA